MKGGIEMQEQGGDAIPADAGSLIVFSLRRDMACRTAKPERENFQNVEHRWHLIRDRTLSRAFVIKKKIYWT